MGLNIRGVLEPLYLGFKHVFKRTFTFKYPYTVLKPTERTVGRHSLDLEKCISCGICANACPAKAIEMVEWREKKYPQMDYGRCVFCEICVYMCPRTALGITNDYELAAYDKKSLVYTPERLIVKPDLIKGRRTVSVRIHAHGGPSHVKEQ